MLPGAGDARGTRAPRAQGGRGRTAERPAGARAARAGALQGADQRDCGRAQGGRGARECVRTNVGGCAQFRCSMHHLGVVGDVFEDQGRCF